MEQADAAVGWGNAREQGAKLPQQRQSQAGQLKQATKPKEAKASQPRQPNPKANLKKRTPWPVGNAEAKSHQKPLPWSQRPNKTKGTQNTPKICSFTTKEEGGFAAAIGKVKGERRSTQQQRRSQQRPASSHQKGPMAKPRGLWES